MARLKTTDVGGKPPRRSRSLAPLALLATFASAMTLTIAYRQATTPDFGFPTAELNAVRALHNVGYTWASVRIEDGIARIGGEAPGDSERVIAYDIVRGALRPMMGKARLIEGVVSELTLAPQPALAALVAPEAPRTQSVAATPQPQTERALEFALAPPPIEMSATAPPTAPYAAPAAEDVAGSAPVETATIAAQTAPEPASAPAAAQQATDTVEAKSDPLDASATAQQPTRTVTFEPEPQPPASVVAFDGTSTEPAPQAEAAQAPEIEARTDAQTDAQVNAQSEAETNAPQPAHIETASLETPEAKTDLAIAAVPANAARTATSPEKAAAGDTAGTCKDDFAQALSAGRIVFGNDSAAIDKASRPLLDTLARIAKRCSKFSFVVEGHTDANGTRAHNLALSKKRAEAVRWALIDRGVDMDKVTAQGYGSARPIVAGTTEAANARNRRIEVSVQEPAPAAQKAASK